MVCFSIKDIRKGPLGKEMYFTRLSNKKIPSLLTILLESHLWSCTDLQ